MNDLAVIDRFTDVFSRYIDSGFGLLGGEVAFLTATLVVIDMTLAGLFWAMGGQDDVLGKLLKKTLYRSEEHTSELQSLMRISYAVFCLKNTKHTNTTRTKS